MAAPSEPAADSGFVPGTRVGRYELLRHLAVGGMAELFLARASGIEGFQKIVVLKRILPHLANNGEFVRMFLHEARLAATLEHPNIVHVSDMGKAADDYFFTMAYLHGKDLLAVFKELGKRGEKLPIEHAITIALGVTSGLHYAHEQVGFDGKPLGIVHRDVSPSNVFITYDGGVKIVDFGIAKAAAQTRLTEVGIAKGKTAYMSPEQCQASPLDRRSDVFSMGIVLYEATTMRRLFRGENEFGVMNRIVTKDVDPPSAVVSDYPPELEAIIMKCLSRDMTQRYQSALELQLDLERFARDAKLQLSNRGLGVFLRELFGDPEVPWTEPGLQLDPHTNPLGTGWTGPPSPGFGIVPEPDNIEPAMTSITTVNEPFRGKKARKAGYDDGGSKTDPAQPAMDPTTQVTQNEYAYGYPRPRPTSIPTTSSATNRVGVGLALGLGAALVIGGGIFAVQYLRVTVDTGTPVAAASNGQPLGGPTDPTTNVAPTKVPPSEVAVGTPSPEQLLATVNDEAQATAMGYPKRHAALDDLKTQVGLAARINTDLQLVLDLRQAGQAPDPCAAYRSALEAVQAGAAPMAAEALPKLQPPQGAGCGGLSELQADVLAGLSTDAGTDAVPPKGAKGKGKGKGKGKKPRGKGKGKGKDPKGDAPPPDETKSDPEPKHVGGKIDDELRPFGGG